MGEGREGGKVSGWVVGGRVRGREGGEDRWVV